MVYKTYIDQRSTLVWQLYERRHFLLLFTTSSLLQKIVEFAVQSFENYHPTKA